MGLLIASTPMDVRCISHRKNNPPSKKEKVGKKNWGKRKKNKKKTRAKPAAIRFVFVTHYLQPVFFLLLSIFLVWFCFFLTFLGPPFLHNGEIRRPTVLNSWPRRRFNFQQPLRFYFIVSPGKGGHRHRPPPTRPTRRKCAALSFFARSTRKSAFCCCCCCCCCLAFGFVFSLFRAFSQFFFDALATPTLDVLDS